jgi:hypothetical protein
VNCVTLEMPRYIVINIIIITIVTYNMAFNDKRDIKEMLMKNTQKPVEAVKSEKIIAAITKRLNALKMIPNVGWFIEIRPSNWFY